MIEIREETPEDVAAIRELNDQAFGQDHEGRLVDALRANGAALLSLVATQEGRLVGHILYSPVVVGKANGAALGPVAVLPERQGQGIGGRLVTEGSQRLKRKGCPFVIVLDHDQYYPKFGFKPASAHGISCEWHVPSPSFLVQVLDETRMQGVCGLAKYRDEFSLVG